MPKDIKTIDDFNPEDARTWDDKQQAVYEVGHREGEGCEAASWTLMLNEAFNIEASDPETANAQIEELIRQAETNGVAWSIKIIDDQHLHIPITDTGSRDATFKGIKNGIRAQYKLETGIDPAPNYPIKAELNRERTKDE